MRKAILILIIYLLILLLFSFISFASEEKPYARALLPDGSVTLAVFVSSDSFLTASRCFSHCNVFVNGKKYTGELSLQDRFTGLCYYKLKEKIHISTAKTASFLPAPGTKARVVFCRKDICPVSFQKEIGGTNRFYIYIEGSFPKGAFLLKGDVLVGRRRRCREGLTGFLSPPFLNKTVRSFLKGEKPQWGWLGIFAEEKEEGIVVEDVDEGSPADKGGLKEGDVIVSYNANPVSSFNELAFYILLTNPGETVKIKVRRGKEEKTLSVKIGTRRERHQPKPEGAAIGIVVKEENRKLIVIKVLPHSRAKLLLPGDVILKLNGRKVSSIRQLQNELKKYKPGDTVIITVKRGESQLDLKVELTERGAPPFPRIWIPKEEKEWQDYLRKQMDRWRELQKKLQKEIEDLRKQLEKELKKYRETGALI